MGTGAEVMWPWLRALAAILEDLGLIPRTHVVVQTICNSSLMGHDNLFCSLQALGILIMQTYIKQNNRTYKNIKSKIK